MKRIGFLLLLATSMGASAPGWSQDHGGERQGHGNGGQQGAGQPGGGPHGGGQGGQPRDQQGGGGPRQEQGAPGGRQRGAQAPPAAARPEMRAPDAPGGGQRAAAAQQHDRGPSIARPAPVAQSIPDQRAGRDRGAGGQRMSPPAGIAHNLPAQGRGTGGYSYRRPPPGDYWRPGARQPRANYWRDNRWINRPVYAPAYRYPGGYGYRQWSIGLILPSLFLGSSYYFDSYYDLGLSRPPYGFRWVRYGPDLLLVNIRTGRIRDVRYGVFG